MAAESAVRFEALEAQAAVLMEVFRARGYETVAPAIIQPADVFIDRMGEAIRGRTYVFTDLDGEELCLRPDLTVPTCRLYLERNPNARAPARYCYNGPAFRYQPMGADSRQPREFRQAGVECIGVEDRAAADAEVLALAVDAVRGAGLDDFRIRLGDLGLFNALIDALDMPERWRLRLRHAFWRPTAFHDLLHRLASGDPLPGNGSALLDALDPDAPEAAEDQVAAYLEARDIPLIGARTLTEITGRLLDEVADAREAPLPRQAVQVIESYLAIAGPAKAVVARLDDLARAAGLDMNGARAAFCTRLERFKKLGLDVKEMQFGAEYGRELEYYTGFVFQIELPDLGRAGQIAGGGRYDGLLADIGAPRPVPAVGCAIHTERLLAGAQGSAS